MTYASYSIFETVSDSFNNSSSICHTSILSGKLFLSAQRALVKSSQPVHEIFWSGVINRSPCQIWFPWRSLNVIHQPWNIDQETTILSIVDLVCISYWLSVSSNTFFFSKFILFVSVKIHLSEHSLSLLLQNFYSSCEFFSLSINTWIFLFWT